MSFVVLGKASVVDRWEGREIFSGGFANLPGYIPNERATDPRDRQGADTATHFFAHAFLSFEMLYADEVNEPSTAQKIQGRLNLAGRLLGEKAGMVNRWYGQYVREYGFESYYYWSEGDRAQTAYNYAVFTGDLFEIISTSAFGGESARERIWNVMRMSIEEFEAVLEQSDPTAASGLQDIGVFRDLRANRRGANFGVTAFYQPTTFPVGDPPYIDPPPR